MYRAVAIALLALTGLAALLLNLPVGRADVLIIFPSGVLLLLSSVAIAKGKGWAPFLAGPLFFAMLLACFEKGLLQEKLVAAVPIPFAGYLIAVAVTVPAVLLFVRISRKNHRN